ncbi:hypothetical protein BBH51_05795 [Aggregatibacter actinomycetemcomitans]|uniref:Uncharacterized protein n=5 Tax=Aggregatibacter actinomycetemcomitans TaxID=714 RepID=A0A5D0EMP5_AGGAC|nr:hypothetical protein [Aggregatibacter actinomycetemcomitans]AMQ93208.1 hypothetical protein ACT75_01010 [Aggregatibacter actinomycetemcomitans]ANU82203.1 hypothetical protein BBH51_05795 [Aggregatibacter actinomycetemcomitans]KND84611.1 hypothetical protein H5P1_0207895 [Aggregatibacter actinomycetemcomitans serotype a str. H5P1]KOE31473.1 hypothetical protein D17P3_0304110 [Aggregatibacter actinomycetemcomitans D17P-3]KOE64279.1 hypothetical protein I63B_0309070 [Aggregatibacter actinomyce
MEDLHFCQLRSMRKIISILLISCNDIINKLDNEYLTNAYKDKYYQNTININEGKVNKLTFKINIHPDNSGLIWEANDNPFSTPPIVTKDYNNITIKGRPKNIGEIYIDFSWTTYGTNISTGRKFQKRYILKVEE